jgi:hypothetical protein
MRLAFCFLSNNVRNFHKLYESFHYNVHDVSYSCVDSITKNVLFNPPMLYCDRWSDWNVKWKSYNFRTPIDMFWMRQDSLDMAGHADLIYIGDDDMIFQKGSTAVINQCCVYMRDNPDCGAIYLGGNFGGEGDKHKDEIYIANTGALGTNRGILVRNRPCVLDDKFHALGAIFDAIVGFTCLLDGLYIARRLHVPIEHDTKNVLKKDHTNLFYNSSYVQEHGMMGKVNKLIGEWKDYNKWPADIFGFYRREAMRKGYAPRYDVLGGMWKTNVGG